ncbi:STAS domain-containing protein [bacterium]|nr:STAS domain-containing protein [bacterium]
MRYQEETRGIIKFVRVDEEQLTSNEAPEMKTAFLKILSSEEEFIVVNMSKVQHMDSTGLGSFLFGIRQAEHLDKEVIFCCLNPRIETLVKIAHLSDVIEVYASEDDAIKEIEDDLDSE